MSTRWRPLGGPSMQHLAGVLMAATLTVSAIVIPAAPVAATAEHDDCVWRLLEAPLESAALPGGWKWLDVSLGEYYWPSLPSPAALVGRLKRAGSGSSEGDVWLTLICEPNADLVLERTAGIALESGARELVVGAVGDGSAAFVVGLEGDIPIMDVAMPGAPTILWRSGDLLGRVVGFSAEADAATLEAIARSVSDVLAAAGLAGPVTDDDACVRRILEAPVETLGGHPKPYAFATVTPTWVGMAPGERPWDESLFFLSCQPEAALVMERTLEIATHSGAEAIEVEPIGDGAVAYEGFAEDGDPTGIELLWRSGDAIGQVRTGIHDLEAALAFARDVDEMLTATGPVPVMATSERDEACVRRLLEAPIETLPDWGGLWDEPRLGFLGRASPTWAGGYYLQLIELGCQPNAELIMARETELAVRSGARELDVAPIGDASVAMGWAVEPPRPPSCGATATCWVGSTWEDRRCRSPTRSCASWRTSPCGSTRCSSSSHLATVRRLHVGRGGRAAPAWALPRESSST